MNILKGVTTFLGSACVGNVVSNIMKNNLTYDKKIDKVIFAVGTFIIGGMISDKATEWVGDQIDQVGNTVKALKESKSERNGVIIYDVEGNIVSEDTNGDA